VFVDKVCVDKVWRRAEEEKAEEEPGIQNQKQEPHTKMWGKSQCHAQNLFMAIHSFIGESIYSM